MGACGYQTWSAWGDLAPHLLTFPSTQSPPDLGALPVSTAAVALTLGLLPDPMRRAEVHRFECAADLVAVFCNMPVPSPSLSPPSPSTSTPPPLSAPA
mmetsp:Transcript_38459/g.108690  ORF Transcript_38459/g.108690 Transcript_38459/m.108690 type:complete len:98 (+) Transcript_38459:541-834(+)